MFTKGKSFVVYPFRVVYLFVPNENREHSAASVLMSVSKKRFKQAVKRNKVKRLMRETYRINKHVLHQTLHQAGKSMIIAFIYLAHEINDYSYTEKKMIEALNNLSKGKSADGTNERRQNEIEK